MSGLQRTFGGQENGVGLRRGEAEVRVIEKGEGGDDASEQSLWNLRGRRRRRLTEQHRQQPRHGECCHSDSPASSFINPLPSISDVFPSQKRLFLKPIINDRNSEAAVVKVGLKGGRVSKALNVGHKVDAVYWKALTIVAALGHHQKAPSELRRRFPQLCKPYGRSRVQS